MSRLVSLMLVCVLFAVPEAFAAKRRSVKVPANPSASTQCVTFGFVRVGLVGTYLTTTPQGNVNYVITYLQDDATTTRTTQKVTTPQGNADAVTKLDGEVVGILRALKHLNVKTTTVVPFLGAQLIEVDIDFVPSLILGPAAGWCVGAKWDVPPSTETIVTRSIAGVQQQVVTTAASQGEVLAIEDITTPAGTFRTLKYRGIFVANGTVSTSTTWVSTLHNIVVRQETGAQVDLLMELQ